MKPIALTGIGVEDEGFMAYGLWLMAFGLGFRV
jgi:hypothetical protein